MSEITYTVRPPRCGNCCHWWQTRPSGGAEADWGYCEAITGSESYLGKPDTLATTGSQPCGEFNVEGGDLETHRTFGCVLWEQGLNR